MLVIIVHTMSRKQLIKDLEHGSLVWDPAPRCSSSGTTGSMTGVLGQLKLETLKKKKKDDSFILQYKGIKCIPTDDFISKIRRGRNQCSMDG